MCVNYTVDLYDIPAAVGSEPTWGTATIWSGLLFDCFSETGEEHQGILIVKDVPEKYMVKVGFLGNFFFNIWYVGQIRWCLTLRHGVPGGCEKNATI